MNTPNQEITYSRNKIPATADIIRLYLSAGLNRPVQDKERIDKMYRNSNLVVTAWQGAELVGVARSLTDFSYCCYLSDLAVKKELRQIGIGKRLIEITREIIGEQSMLLLLSAPGAMDYYPAVGFETVKNGFIINRSS